MRQSDAISDAYKWRAFAAMAVGLFFGVMDFGGTGVAAPSIAADLGLPLSTASWIVLSSSLTISAVLLPVGGLSDIVGRKRSYLAGGVLFGAGAIAVAASPSPLPLFIGRVVQAVGAAIVMANGMAIVAIVFPASERGKGMGLIASTAGLGAIAGPIFSGAVVDALGWQAFYLIIGAGTLVSVVWSWLVLDERRISTPKSGSLLRYDWLGALLSAAGLTVAILILTSGDRVGWSSAWVVGGAILVIGLLVGFVLRERNTASPMFDLDAFKSSQFSWAVSARFLGFLGSSAWFFLMPFYLQDVLGFAPGRVGIIMFPGAFGFAMLGSVSGRLSDRVGVKPFTVAGLTLVIVGGLMFSSLDGSSPLYFIMPALLINGIGMGLWVAPNMSAAIDAVENTAYGVVGAFVNLVRNTASVTGIAVATAIVVSVMSSRGFAADISIVGETGAAEVEEAFLSGARYAYLALVSFAVVALVAALKTQDPKREDRERETPGVRAAAQGAASDGD